MKINKLGIATAKTKVLLARTASPPDCGRDGLACMKTLRLSSSFVTVFSPSRSARSVSPDACIRRYFGMSILPWVSQSTNEFNELMRDTRSPLLNRNRLLVGLSFFEYPVGGLCQVTCYRDHCLAVSLIVLYPLVKLDHVAARPTALVEYYDIGGFDKRPLKVMVNIWAASSQIGSCLRWNSPWVPSPSSWPDGRHREIV